MKTVLNDEVVVPLQNGNTAVPLQGTDTVHPADENLKILNHKCLRDQIGRDRPMQMTI